MHRFVTSRTLTQLGRTRLGRCTPSSAAFMPRRYTYGSDAKGFKANLVVHPEVQNAIQVRTSSHLIIDAWAEPYVHSSTNAFSLQSGAPVVALESTIITRTCMHVMMKTRAV
jgi:hypothetical protein